MQRLNVGFIDFTLRHDDVGLSLIPVVLLCENVVRNISHYIV